MKYNHDIIKLTDITVDPSVQRIEGLDVARASNMAKAFDPLLLGTVVVSMREDGSLVILDGMHRAEAARLAEYEGDLHAIVYEGLTIEQEREIFVGLNESRSVSALTKFVMRVGYLEPDAVAMNEVLLSLGWKVGPGSGTGVFSAVAALEAVYKTGAGTLPKGKNIDLVRQTMKVLTAAWGHDAAGVTGLLVKGAAKVLGTYGEAANDVELASALARSTPGLITSRARSAADIQRTPVDSTAAFIMVNEYNLRKRAHALEPWSWKK